MALDQEEQELLRRLFNRLEDDPLPPGSELYEPPFESPDADDPVALMMDLIRSSRLESFQLFSGFRGTGKTTELLRLKARLEADGYFVVYSDALEYLNPAEPIDISGLLMALAGAFSDQLEPLGAPPAEGSFWTRLTNFLNTEISLKETSVKLEAETPGKAVVGGGKAGVDLKFELRSGSKFRQSLKTMYEARPKEFKDQVNAFFADGIKFIRRVKGEDTRIVFIFDQMEQMRGTLETEEAVIRSVERIFSTNIDLLKLQYIHAVYTVPPWMKFRVAPQVSITILWTKHLWRNDLQRSRDEDAWQSYRALVHKRLGDDGLRRLFSAAPGAPNALVDQMIEMSGGQFRDLLRLLQGTVLRAMSLPSLPVSPAVVDRTVNAVRRDLLPIAGDDAKWLAVIERTRKTGLPNNEPGPVMRLARFLDTHSVLYFMNGREWYDVHPLIRDEVIELTAAEPDQTT